VSITIFELGYLRGTPGGFGFPVAMLVKFPATE
jgi:hypothetical protein